MSDCFLKPLCDNYFLDFAEDFFAELDFVAQDFDDEQDLEELDFADEEQEQP